MKYVMKVAVVGAGFTGLSAAYRLLQAGHDVTIFEKDSQAGGLAVGYQEKNWEWSLEKHYHHWFTNDTEILNLAHEIHHTVLTRRINTSVFIDDHFYQLDSPGKILTFPKLSLIDRIRMASALAFLRFNPFWKPLEKIRATTVLPKIMGNTAWNLIWWPQLKNKMGEYADQISLVWFWTRITKRTPSVAYPEGGFLAFANHLVAEIEEHGGKVNFNTETTQITNTSLQYSLNSKTHTEQFDRIIVTLPSFLFQKVTPDLPSSYTKKLTRLKGLSATNMVLRLKKPFFPNNTYWLSICELGAPIMALIEHTNFMNKKHYGNEHLLYIGNYAKTDDKLDWSKEKVLNYYDSFLNRIHPHYKEILIGYELFKAPYAQPIVPTHYSKMIPPFHTPLPHVYLANIEQVYPWDRGTNYAVKLGENIAKVVINEYNS